jgi:hypothetical protein
MHMTSYRLALAAAGIILMLSGGAAVAQERQRGSAQFDDHAQQVTRDWYQQHQSHPPAGLRDQDRLSNDEESRLHEGAVLDPDMRRKVHSAPHDLERQLPPAPSNHRYVAIGGHIGLIDHNYQVKAVIHLHDNH